MDLLRIITCKNLKFEGFLAIRTKSFCTSTLQVGLNCWCSVYFLFSGVKQMICHAVITKVFSKLFKSIDLKRPKIYRNYFVQ